MVPSGRDGVNAFAEVERSGDDVTTIGRALTVVGVAAPVKPKATALGIDARFGSGLASFATKVNVVLAPGASGAAAVHVTWPFANAPPCPALTNPRRGSSASSTVSARAFAVPVFVAVIVYVTESPGRFVPSARVVFVQVFADVERSAPETTLNAVGAGGVDGGNVGSCESVGCGSSATVTLAWFEMSVPLSSAGATFAVNVTEVLWPTANVPVPTAGQVMVRVAGSNAAP